MIIASSEKVPLEKCPALVLNADFRPLSYYPLSLWCWQDAVKSVFLERVSIVSNYKRKIRSPSFEMNLPSVIALKNFINPYIIICASIFTTCLNSWHKLFIKIFLS